VPHRETIDTYITALGHAAVTEKTAPSRWRRGLSAADRLGGRGEIGRGLVERVGPQIGSLLSGV
jgi:hypothetical protein